MLQGPDVMGGSRPSCRCPLRPFAFERPRSARRALRFSSCREAWPLCWPPAFRVRRRHSARVFWRVLTEIRLWLRELGCLRGLVPEYPLVGSLPFRRLSLAGLERRWISVKPSKKRPFRWLGDGWPDRSRPVFPPSGRCWRVPISSGAGGSEARRAPLLHLLACSADVRRGRFCKDAGIL